MTGCALFPVRRSSTSVEVNFYDLSYVKAAKHYKYGGQHVNTVPSGGNSAKYGAYLGRVFQIITPVFIQHSLSGTVRGGRLEQRASRDEYGDEPLIIMNQIGSQYNYDLWIVRFNRRRWSC